MERVVSEDDKFRWRSFLQEKTLVIFFLGFSSGLPLWLVFFTLTAWLYEAELPTSTISKFAFIMFAYSFKFMWSPLVDAVKIPLLTKLLGRRRGWLLVAQLGLAASIATLSQIDPAAATTLFFAVGAMAAWFSATQDIVVDAYRVEIASDEMQGILAASYQYGYRVAGIVSGAGALYLADFYSWELSYLVMAGCVGVGILTTLYCKEPQNTAAPDYHFAGTAMQKAGKWFTVGVIGPVADFFKRYGRFAAVILVFMAVFRNSREVVWLVGCAFWHRCGWLGDPEVWCVTLFDHGSYIDRQYKPVFCSPRADRSRHLDAGCHHQLRQLCTGLRRDGFYRLPVQPYQCFVHRDAICIVQFIVDIYRQA